MRQHKQAQPCPDILANSTEQLDWLVGEVNRQGEVLDDILSLLSARPVQKKKQKGASAPVNFGGMLDMVLEINHAPQTLTQIQSALSDMGASKKQLNATQQLHQALHAAGWQSPKKPTRLNGKVGRWWHPPA